MKSLLLLTALAAIVAWAQPPTPGSTFEVVSIKPSDPSAKQSLTSFDANALHARGVNLNQLVQWAYQVQGFQVQGGPKWRDSQFFDVEAKADGAHAYRELQTMLRPTLAERFNLAVHTERVEKTADLLKVGKNGLKSTTAQPGRPSGIALKLLPEDPPTLRVTGQSVSMTYLVGYLSGLTERPMMDRTGVTESIDFTVDVSWSFTGGGDKKAVVEGAMLEAVRRLGFTIDSSKEPVEMLIIDRADQPSAN